MVLYATEMINYYHFFQFFSGQSQFQNCGEILPLLHIFEMVEILTLWIIWCFFLEVGSYSTLA